MKFLVVIAVAFFAQSAVARYYGGYYGPADAPVVTPSGFLADTPEVAAAKAVHFAQVAKAGGSAYVATPYAAGAYYGTTGVSPTGYIADTPEVAAAKAAHFAEVAKASGAAAANVGAYGYAGAGAYQGLLAAPVVTPSGFLADTPEVAAAKVAHLNLVAQAGQVGAYSGPYYAGALYNNGLYNNGQYIAYSGQYAGQYEGQYGANNEGQYVRDQNNW